MTSNKIEINSKFGKSYYNALIKKYEADIANSKANLELYFSDNLAGIGEHSDLLEEHDKWIENLANAQDKLNTLKQTFEVLEKI